MFIKYPHLERFGNVEVENIDIGKCYIFPKIDGTNASLWYDKTNETICAGSRNRELSLGKDNAGFYNTICSLDEIEGGYVDFFIRYPNLRLYGEWLVPHTLKTYREDAWRKFYIFDVHCPEKGFLPYEEYKTLLDECGLEYLSPLMIVTNPDDKILERCLANNKVLIKDGEGIGEGIVIKNYEFQNKFGRVTWAKLINNEFKEKHYKEMGSPEMELVSVESQIIENFVTPHLVEKEYSKIVTECNGWTSKYIPRLLHTVYYSLITEEMWSILKKYKNCTIDFRKLQGLCTNKVKEIKKDLF